MSEEEKGPEEPETAQETGGGGLQGSPFQDIRFWAGLLLVPVIAWLITLPFEEKRLARIEELKQEQAQALEEQRKSAALRGLPEEEGVYATVAPEKAAACDFSDWVGKPLSMYALKALGRDYRFYNKGSELAPVGDPQVINIELDKYTVARVWCG